MSQDSRLQRRPLPSTPDQPAWASNYMVPRPATKASPGPPGLSSSAQVNGSPVEGIKTQAASNAIYCLSARYATAPQREINSTSCSQMLLMLRLFIRLFLSCVFILSSTHRKEEAE